LLLDAAVLAIIVGLVAGGRFGRLNDLDLRAPGMFIAAAAVQAGLMVAGARGAQWAGRVGPAVYVGTLAMVLVGLWWNRRLPGVWVVGVGVLLNFLVIAANGGSMPVERGLAERAGDERMVRLLDSPTYTRHAPMSKGTRLRALGDVVALPMLIPRPKFFSPGSIGDVFVTAGACWLILAGMGAFGLRSGKTTGKIYLENHPRGKTL
jgi:hypothetical protein